MDNDYELLYLAKEDIDIVVEILYKKYKNIIYYKSLKYCQSNSALEDYINEAKLTIYEAVEKYKDDIPFLNFLNICLDNNLLNYRKGQNRMKYKMLNEAISLDEINIETKFQSHIEKNNAEKKLLKEQNYSAREISEITDNNLRTVYNIIKRIQNKFTKVMSS